MRAYISFIDLDSIEPCLRTEDLATTDRLLRATCKYYILQPILHTIHRQIKIFNHRESFCKYHHNTWNEISKNYYVSLQNEDLLSRKESI